MHIPKHYFHDGGVLVLLAVNAFLTILTTILISLKLDADSGTAHIVQYRSNLGVSGFKSGGNGELINFILFALAVVIISTVLSMRLYHVRKHFALMILALCSMLLTLGLIVSNALLVLR